LVYSDLSAIGGIVSGGFGFLLLLLCEDVSRRLRIGFPDGAVVAVPVAILALLSSAAA
jgi:hypothetical protein